MRLFWPFKRRRTIAEVAQSPPEVEETKPVADLWRVFGASVRGASHERSDLPNQDAICWRPASGTGRSILLALADGHGSPKSFRSDTGSRLAVETALGVFEEFLDQLTVPPDLSACKRAVDEQLPVAIERRWKAAITRHLEEYPLLVKEVARLEESQGAAARQAVEKDPILAYGTTLIGIVLHESFLVCLQLGDGDILVVTRAGEVVRPMADDARLFANETTSLGSPDSWRDFRVCFQAFAETPPALVLASTDGYSNAFSTPEGFLAVGVDLFEMLRAEGTKSLAEDLPKWLDEASRQGSGDDVTAGIVCCLQPMREAESAITAIGC
jgi:serine/threonine protein phosphatase PrpC